MKIIDVFIRSYYNIERGESIRKLDGALSTVNGLLTLNVCSILYYIRGVFVNLGGINLFHNISIPLVVISEMVMCGIVGCFSIRILKRKYLNKGSYMRIIKTNVTKFCSVLIVAIHFILTIYLLLHSLNYLFNLGQ